MNQQKSTLLVFLIVVCALGLFSVLQVRRGVEKRERVEQLALEPVSLREGDLEIFVTDWCPYCRALEQYLQARQIPYQRRNVEEDQSARARYIELGGGGFPLIRVGSSTISGFNEADLVEALVSRTKELKSCNFTC